MDSNAENQKDPCLVKTHFLKPYVTSIDGPVAELPRNQVSVSSSTLLKDSFSRVSFTGFWFPNEDFKSWVKKMKALHEPTWRKAGIFQAIKASTHRIIEDRSLILALVEKWCPETKSFIFPWGEATITLEDVMILLGFSPLGSPPASTCLGMRDSVEKLKKARAEIVKNLCKDGRVNQLQWTKRFRDRDDPLEHEAFLAMWLSHYVFPSKTRRSISKTVLPMAVRLARGERLAFAPAVLASIYRDLGQIRVFARDMSKDRNLNLKSLFKLVQVWAWERFRNIRPEANRIRIQEPRIAQWSCCLRQRDESLCFDDFEWRPYTKHLENWNPPRFYLKEAMWMTVDENLDDEFVSFARCLRVSKLVGIGFVKDYYPNRVAMQFGLSQDLPGLVSDDRSNFTEKQAWDNYSKSLDGSKLYVPCRFATTSVTARYRDWWLKSFSEFLCNSVDDHPMSLGKLIRKLGKGFPARIRRCRTRRESKNLRLEVPLSRLFRKELMDKASAHLRNKRPREDDDDITIAQFINSREKAGGDSSESVGKRRRHEVDKNDSLICRDRASGDDETVVAPEDVEHRSEEENGNEAEDIAVLFPSDEIHVTHAPLDSNEVDQRSDEEETLGEGEDITAMISPAENNSSDHNPDDEVHVNGINAEKETVVNDGAKEADDDEMLKQRKLAIDELASNIEAGIMKLMDDIKCISARRNMVMAQRRNKASRSWSTEKVNQVHKAT